MNEEIERIFQNFSVNGESVPVKFLHYEGHGEPYVVYMETEDNDSLTADDDLQAYVTYYDFDVYSRGNYTAVINAVKSALINHDWVWQVSRTSEDMFETDTGYYHKTLCFATFKEVEEEWQKSV